MTKLVYGILSLVIQCDTEDDSGCWQEFFSNLKKFRMKSNRQQQQKYNEMDNEELLRRFRQIGLTDEQLASASAIAAESSAFDRGELFCSTEDVFSIEWQPYQAEDFVELRRDWSVYKETLTGTPVLARVYSRTRDSATDPEHHAAFSSSVMSVRENLRNVRLCSFQLPTTGTTNMPTKHTCAQRRAIREGQIHGFMLPQQSLD